MARGQGFVFVASVALAFAFATTGVSATTSAGDVTAIRNLYNALGRPSRLALWADPLLSLDPCNGTGPTVPSINCTLATPPATYVITALDLRNTGSYSGVVPNEIGAFANLQTLILTGLNFAGIPSSIQGLQQLQTLAIDNNVMSTLPNELGNIKNLTSLTLGGNQFSVLPSVIPQLTNLIRLDLSYNNWQAPFPAAMGNLINLQALIAMSSNLPVPFGGSRFPEWLFQLQNLREIILDYNRNFGAQLNGSLGFLPELGYFSCVQCGLVGRIPDTFGRFQYLGALHLSDNFLSGSIPPPLGNLSFYLHDLRLDRNNLTGPIPPELAQLQTVELNLSHNQLNGTIPLEFYNATGLIFLNNNSLSGPLPYFLSTAPAQFTYGGNRFCSRVIGELCGNVTDSYILRTLKYSIGNPRLLQNWTGDAPCNSSWRGVTCNSSTGASAVAVNASRIQANGTIPNIIGGLLGLQSLDLSFNRIYGSLPASMGNLTSLTTLLLNNNELNGTIPESLAALPNLQNVDLSYNRFPNGSLPEGLVNVTTFNNQTVQTSAAAAPAPAPGVVIATLPRVNTTAAVAAPTVTLPLLNLNGP